MDDLPEATIWPAEEILNLLAKIPESKVIAHTSSFVFRRKARDIRQIGNALDVGTALEGSILRVGRRIRVTAQLIGVSDFTGGHPESDVSLHALPPLALGRAP
jgi:TolB-like protein